MAAEWIVERTAHRRFPFRITIREGGRAILAVRAQSVWPGPGQQIFCLREPTVDPTEPLEPVERVLVAHLGRVGRKLTVALDRPGRKRCEFLTVVKPGPDGRPREQIFFRTESGIRAHRSRTRMELLPRTAELVVVVDPTERYPWRFPGATVRRRKLPVGDYALLDGERLVATVERKTFDNLLVEVGTLQAFHHHLGQLTSRPCAALVIEAQYADFLDEKRLKGRWPAAHLARVLAEIAALHPTLPVVFAGNRKLANAWCHRFFAACAARGESPQLDLVREALAGYEADPEQSLDERIRRAALEEFAESFAAAELTSRFPEASAERVRRLLRQLRAEKLLESTGRGRGTRWTPATGDPPTRGRPTTASS
jgi:hypothetical protein